MRTMLALMALMISGVLHADTVRLPGSVQAFSAAGFDVAMQDNQALVGIPNGPAFENNPGLVRTYQRQDGVWVLGEDLFAPGGVNGDRFGHQIVMEKDRAVISSVSDNVMVENTFYTELGSVHIYELDNEGQWQHTAQLLPPVMADEARFGASLALSGDHLMVQAFDPTNNNQTNRGVIYVYRFMAGTWQLVDTIEPPVSNNDTELGRWAIELQGNRAFINNGIRSGDQFSGTVLVFERRGLEWVQTDEISSGTNNTDDVFGFSISAWQNVLAIGAHKTDEFIGAVYIFEYDQGTWQLNQMLMDPSDSDIQTFGWDVDLQNQQLLVGAINDVEDAQGAVYVYNKTDTEWQRVARLEAENIIDNNDFGTAISADNGQVLIGADTQGTFRGAAYVSDVAPATERLPLNQGLNGAWFNPSIPGQGIFLDVNAEADFSFMGLFSYDNVADDQLGGQIGAPGQRWLVGDAAIDQHHESIHFDLYYAFDGLFDDARAVQVPDTEAYGWLTMQFISCLEAEVTYHITEPNLSGSFLVSRPAAGSGTLCVDLDTTAPTAADDDFNYALNGGWFNPATGGQGLFIDKFKGINTAFMGWFTFDTELVSENQDSNIGALGQRWLVGTGEVDADDSNVINYELYYTYGGSFLDETAVSIVEPGSYGVLRIEFIDCNQARVDYSVGDGDLSGSYDMVRSIPNSSGCAVK